MATAIVESDLLPAADMAATALVGRVIRSGEAALTRLGGFRSRHIWNRRLRLIFWTATEMARAGAPVDLTTICQRLSEKGLLVEAGGRAYVSAIETDACTLESLQWTAHRVRCAAAQRLVAQIGNDIYKLQATEGLEPELALKKALRLSNRAALVSSFILEPPWENRRCLRVDEFLAKEFAPTTWAVEGEGRLLIPSASVGALFGWGGVGKSLQALELAISQAAGIPYLRTFTTAQNSVLYVDFELPEKQLQHRVRWLLSAMGIDPNDLPLFLWSASGMILGQERNLDLERRIRETGAKETFIDSITMAALWDELDPVAVTKVFRNCLFPIRDQGVGLTLVDHSRKPGEGGRGTGSSAHDLRGTTAKFNCLDWAIGLQYEKSGKDERVIFSCAKARYGPSWEPFSARLEPIFPEGRRSVFEGDYEPGGGSVKSAAIEAAVRNLLCNQDLPQATLIHTLEKQGHKERTVEDVLSRMVRSRDVEKLPDPSDGRRKLLHLKIGGSNQ